MLGPKGPFCQSCGMPLSKDPLGGGTNTDGTISIVYCSHCYRGGAFTEPNITLAEMTAKVEDKLREMRFPGFIARWFARKTSNLARWKSGRA